jgi:hypothetical protein
MYSYIYTHAGILNNFKKLYTIHAWVRYANMGMGRGLI